MDPFAWTFLTEPRMSPLATSALPTAPVIDDTPRAGVVRRRLAVVLHRTARRLSPDVIAPRPTTSGC